MFCQTVRQTVNYIRRALTVVRLAKRFAQIIRLAIYNNLACEDGRDVAPWSPSDLSQLGKDGGPPPDKEKHRCTVTIVCAMWLMELRLRL